MPLRVQSMYFAFCLFCLLSFPPPHLHHGQAVQKGLEARQAQFFIPSQDALVHVGIKN